MSEAASVFSTRKGYLLALAATFLGFTAMGLQMWRLLGKSCALLLASALRSTYL